MRTRALTFVELSKKIYKIATVTAVTKKCANPKPLHNARHLWDWVEGDIGYWIVYLTSTSSESSWLHSFSEIKKWNRLQSQRASLHHWSKVKPFENRSVIRFLSMLCQLPCSLHLTIQFGWVVICKGHTDGCVAVLDFFRNENRAFQFSQRRNV